MKKTIIFLTLCVTSIGLLGCGKKLPKGEFDMEQGVLIMPDVEGDQVDIEE